MDDRHIQFWGIGAGERTNDRPNETNERIPRRDDALLRERARARRVRVVEHGRRVAREHGDVGRVEVREHPVERHRGAAAAVVVVVVDEKLDVLAMQGRRAERACDGGHRGVAMSGPPPNSWSSDPGAEVWFSFVVKSSLVITEMDTFGVRRLVIFGGQSIANPQYAFSLGREAIISVRVTCHPSTDPKRQRHTLTLWRYASVWRWM